MSTRGNTENQKMGIEEKINQIIQTNQQLQPIKIEKLDKNRINISSIKKKIIKRISYIPSKKTSKKICYNKCR